MSTADLRDTDAEGWVCVTCGTALERRSVDITYMASVFKVELPRCPKCGFTLIPPELALGRMLEAEKILEDK
ncbi:MAG: DNA-binding protein [Desulfovibrio sp.]|nr:DNA-binding protein [Desulfovibrio sp.]